MSGQKSRINVHSENGHVAYQINETKTIIQYDTMQANICPNTHPKPLGGV